MYKYNNFLEAGEFTTKDGRDKAQEFLEKATLGMSRTSSHSGVVYQTNNMRVKVLQEKINEFDVIYYRDLYNKNPNRFITAICGTAGEVHDGN